MAEKKEVKTEVKEVKAEKKHEPLWVVIPTK